MSGTSVLATSATDNLGPRLRAVREARGLSLRESARRLGVSASFLSQLETGKSQPSVATLYALSRHLDVTIDQLFDDPETAPAESVVIGRGASGGDTARGSRSERARPSHGFLADGRGGAAQAAWPTEPPRARLEIWRPGERGRIAMDGGVTWEQLATNTGQDMEFLDVVYEPHSSSTNDDRMLRHQGYEFGYVIEGELEVTFGFEVFTVRAGDSFGFDSGVPHLFRNLRDEPARFISCNRHSLA
jgi:quercetin dioxygenase-like cupin family protein/DNA-binding XRE family transcriptional regulator